MSVSETDLELLETYLDDELSAEEGEALRRRLSSEPALVAAMDELRHDRAVRQQAFGTMELTERQALMATDSIVRSVRQAATREVARSGRMRLFRQVAAAAACIMVGVLVGWMGHSRTELAQQPMISLDSANGVTSRGTGGTLVSNNSIRGGNEGGFNVQITDDAGRVLAVQHFDTLNEAREFSNDLSRWQARQRRMRNGDIRLIGDDF